MEDTRELRVLNKFQTPLDDKIIEKLPREVYLNILTHLDEVEFVRRLTDVNILQLDDLPKDESGKVIQFELDEDDNIVHDYITNPHELTNMDYFRQAAIHYKKHGQYTLLTPNPHPKSPYKLFWKEEVKRCKEGMVREDGEWIPGELYFYWNYCPIMLSEDVKGSKRANRVQDFPNPWLGDYLWFHYMEASRNHGKHCGMIKCRGIGADIAEDEEVITPEGKCYAKDIKDGDCLIDAEGNPTTVLEVIPQGIKNIFKLTFEDNTVIECSIDHLWEVFSDEGVCSTLTTGELLLEYHNYKFPKYTLEGEILQRLDNIEITDLYKNTVCFSVDNDRHVFQLKNGIITHNSFKGGVKGPHRTLFFKKQKTFYVAYEKEYLVKDGILNKA